MERLRNSSCNTSLLMLVALVACGCAGTPRPVEVPFEPYGGIVIVTGSVNGSPPVRFVVDTGANHTALGPAEAGRPGITAGEARTGGGAGPAKVSYTLLHGAVVRFEGRGGRAAELALSFAAAAPAGVFEQLSSAAGRRIEGILGYDLFRGCVVEIDYDRRVMRLHESKTYRYRGTGEVLPVRVASGWALVGATVTAAPGTGALPCALVVDTGSGEDLWLRKRFVDAHSEVAAVETTEGRAIGVGGVEVNRHGRLAEVRLGASRVPEPAVTLVSSSDARFPSHVVTGADGTLGAGVLSHFKVIFDYPRRRMILERGRRPWRTERSADSGMGLLAEGPALDVFVVGYVTSGSPAAEAGVEVGDVVTAVNGRPARGMSLEAVREALRTPGRDVTLELRRGGRVVVCTVRLPHVKAPRTAQ